MSTYLMHHGIKGQRWGVRRYENADGSLTEAGKRRYAKEAAKDRVKAVKNRSSLSDKELDARIARLEKENRLKRATEENLGRKLDHEPALQRGKKWFDEAFTGPGNTIRKVVLTGIGVYAGKRFVDFFFGSEAASFVRLPKK